ncbi:MAG: polysaccharide deacetylase family protein [Lachnospiraceae bacterium]|nr:polysaccharide deacetylase family protein [Lachnospiraceae bacterium]
MKIKKTKLWQKQAIKDLLFLNLIIVVAFAFQSLRPDLTPPPPYEVPEALLCAANATHSNDSTPKPQNPRINAGNENEDAKKVAITFDDGPHPRYTEPILDGLKERGVVATFFITGDHAEKYPEIVKRIHDEGHLIGNHTYSHIQLTKYNLEEFADELSLTSQIIADITGAETLFVRPPYGLWDIRLEADLNMFPVMWTIDPRDWARTNVTGIVNDVVNKVKPNDIILLHDEYESTQNASLIIIDQLLEAGYEFVTVEEILLN